MSRDTATAIGLLLLCGIFLHASFDIRETDYGTISAALWPRLILGGLTLLGLVYLAQSLLRPAPATGGGGGIANVLWCYGLFTLFLLAIPALGMLVAGILFVFACLCALGPRHGRALARHAALAVVAVAGMWAVFTYGLSVMLPTGELFSGSTW